MSQSPLISDLHLPSLVYSHLSSTFRFLIQAHYLCASMSTLYLSSISAQLCGLPSPQSLKAIYVQPYDLRLFEPLAHFLYPQLEMQVLLLTAFIYTVLFCTRRRYHKRTVTANMQLLRGTHIKGNKQKSHGVGDVATTATRSPFALPSRVLQMFKTLWLRNPMGEDRSVYVSWRCSRI